jgi:hypothetical protein
MTNGLGFDCAVCGDHHDDNPHNFCSYCHETVCNECWFTQAGKGHELAEHKHEMAFESSSYRRGDEDDDGF